MKSVTTCPSCQTQFLVTDEQLSQYHGKVRCGHCLSVFNAVDHLAVEVQPIAAPSEQEKIASTSTGHVDAPSDPAESPQTEQVPVEIPRQDDAAPAVQAHTADEPMIGTSAENTPAETEDALPIQHVSESTPEINAPSSKRADLLKELFEQANLPLEEVNATLPDGENTKIEPELGDLAQAELDAVQFQEDIRNVNTSETKPEYQYYLEERKRISPALIALGAVLVFSAMLQVMFFYRHTIAMAFPQTKPLLVSICQTIGCKIDLPKEIQLFSIDDSTIEEDANHEGVVRLTSTITNRADFSQAYPNLEVTLTDTQDQPKLRRIFKPNEYLSKEQILEQGIAAGDSININMPLMSDDLKPAGFRLLVSY